MAIDFGSPEYLQRLTQGISGLGQGLFQQQLSQQQRQQRLQDIEAERQFRREMLEEEQAFKQPQIDFQQQTALQRLGLQPAGKGVKPDVTILGQPLVKDPFRVKKEALELDKLTAQIKLLEASATTKGRPSPRVSEEKKGVIRSAVSIINQMAKDTRNFQQIEPDELTTLKEAYKVLGFNFEEEKRKGNALNVINNLVSKISFGTIPKTEDVFKIKSLTPISNTTQDNLSTMSDEELINLYNKTLNQ